MYEYFTVDLLYTIIENEVDLEDIAYDALKEAVLEKIDQVNSCIVDRFEASANSYVDENLMEAIDLMF